MAFSLKKDRQIIAPAQDLLELDIVFPKPTIVPVDIYGSQLAKQVEKEPGRASLPMMTMTDVSDSHRLSEGLI